MFSILVLGGSQGAKIFGEKIPEVIKILKRFPDRKDSVSGAGIEFLPSFPFIIIPPIRFPFIIFFFDT